MKTYWSLNVEKTIWKRLYWLLEVIFNYFSLLPWVHCWHSKLIMMLNQISQIFLACRNQMMRIWLWQLRREGREILSSFLRENSEGTYVNCKFNPGIALLIHILSSSLKKVVAWFLISSSWSSTQAMKATHPAFSLVLNNNLCFM